MSEILETIAWGYVGDPGTLINGRGATITHTGVGTYDINLSGDRSVDDTEMMLTLQPTDILTPSFSPGAGDTKKQVLFFDTGASTAADTGFFFKIERFKIL